MSVSTRLPEEAIIVAKPKALHGKLPSSQLINRRAPRQQAIAAHRTLALGRVLFSLWLPYGNCTVRWGRASPARAFCEKVESRWDSRESVFVIQASHWTGGQHEWGSHIRMTCDAASLKRLRLVIRTRKLRICAA